MCAYLKTLFESYFYVDSLFPVLDFSNQMMDLSQSMVPRRLHGKVGLLLLFFIQGIPCPYNFPLSYSYGPFTLAVFAAISNRPCTLAPRNRQ